MLLLIFCYLEYLGALLAFFSDQGTLIEIETEIIKALAGETLESEALEIIQ